MTDFWNEYAEVSKQEGGGGGIVTRARVETGYKVYVSGADQADTFFPVAPNDAGARNTAKAKAQAMGRPNWGIQIKAYRDSAVVRGQPATWQSDRHFNTDSWTDACKQVVVPSLKDNGIVNLPWEGWCRIGFQPDPFKQAKGEAGMTDQDQDGNPRFPQVAYVVEVFADEDAARAAISVVTAEAGVSVAGDVSVPEAYGDLETWKTVWASMYKDQQEGEELKDIAKQYQATVAEVSKALAAHIPM